MQKHNNGFTLAEVLITLGIIGVVAAMTMPVLVKKHERMVLETAFKKSYSSLSQAIYAVDIETLSSLSDGSTGNATSEFYNELFSKFKIINEKNNNNAYERNQKFYSYTRKVEANSGNVAGCPQAPRRILSDGSFIGGMFNCWTNWILIDTNGRKKPNAYGHDIFLFFLNTNTKKLMPVGSETTSWGGPYSKDDNGFYCSPTSDNADNGSTCARFAVANKCPWDDKKTYWECLP